MISHAGGDASTAFLYFTECWQSGYLIQSAGLDKNLLYRQIWMRNLTKWFTVHTSSDIAEKLRACGLRPTRQRVFLGELMLDGTDKHITPEMVAAQAGQRGEHIALGTIYNCLRQFADAGLLKQVHSVKDRLVYDTNLGDHHHFLDVETGELTDVPSGEISLASLPHLPQGFGLDAVEVTIRMRKTSEN